MAWETRNGRRYYYLKHRHGNSVRSEYVGSGESGELAARLTEAQARQRRDAARVRRDRKASVRAVDQALDALADQCREAAFQQLAELGLYQHHGTWRRKQSA